MKRESNLGPVGSRARDLLRSDLPTELSRRLELHVGTETIDVWFDEAGIHFDQPGGRCGSTVLPWTEAIAFSLIPERLPRSGSAQAV